VPSPNHEARPDGAVIDTLVLHYTGMRSGQEAIARLCDPTAKVSAHYVVEEDGVVFRLVAETRRAAHAGISHWRGRSALNANSIGIEIVNPGHEWGYRPFPALQMAAVCDLCLEIMARHPIEQRNVVAGNCLIGRGWRRMALGFGRARMRRRRMRLRCCPCLAPLAIALICHSPCC